MTPAFSPRRLPSTTRIRLAPLKDDARARYCAVHPYRLAVEALPDSVTREEFIVQLRILLALARAKDA